MRVLVADDDPVSRTLVAGLVSRAGHEVVTCADGGQALAALDAPDAPRLAIIDWIMPVLEGPELCRRVRARAGSQPHLVLLTALTGKESLVEGIEAGADEYLPKPIDPAELRARLAGWARALAAAPAPEAAQSVTIKDPPAPPKPTNGTKRRGLSRDLTGQVVDGKYEVQGLLGVGGMGAVYRARHLLLGETVALKVIHESLAEDEKVHERFLREARAAMKFVHPSAIPVRDFGRSPDGVLYMTLGFSHGVSLRSIVARETRLPVPRALAIVRQCLTAIKEAHAHGIVHRDLKPENVLVEEAGTANERARICDFGLAKIVAPDPATAASTTITGESVIGTPHYMAPEQAKGLAIGDRADIYSMGCILHELIAGTKPFEGAVTVMVLMRHVREAPPRLSKLVGGVSPKLEALVARMLAKAPEDRPSAAEAIEAIDGLGAPLRAPRALRVLLAEDNPVSQRLTGRLLEKWGHTVTVVPCGEEAIVQAAAGRFDVILMDGDMPGVDGFEATAAIREAERATGARCPIIALTAYDQEDDRRRCLSAGMDDYVSKPVEPGALFAAIEAVVAAAGRASARPALRAFDGSRVLDRLDGDVSLLGEIARAFVAAAPALAGQIRGALDAGDPVALARAAHELKGSAADCAASAISELASRIEALAARSELDAAREPVAALEAALEESLELLEDVASPE